MGTAILIGSHLFPLNLQPQRDMGNTNTQSQVAILSEFHPTIPPKVEVWFLNLILLVLVSPRRRVAEEKTFSFVVGTIRMVKVKPTPESVIEMDVSMNRAWRRSLIR